MCVCVCRIAYTALNDHEGARECYRKALELDPDNQSYQNNLEIAETKLKEAAVGVSSAPAEAINVINSKLLIQCDIQQWPTHIFQTCII